MVRKTFVAAAVSLVLLLTLATPHFSHVGAWGVPRDLEGEQRTEVNNLGKVLGAPFRALGKLFGGGKKKKPISKITDKDIAKFESTKVSRVNDAQTPVVPTKTDDGSLSADHLRRGRELLNAGQLNEAIAELTLATSIDPKSGEAQMLLGIAYDRKGLGARARDAFETALHAPDDKAMHLNNLGFLLYRQGDYDEAIKYLKRAAKINPDDKRIWNNLTTAQLAADKFDDAYKSSVHVLGEFESRVKIAKRLEWRGYLKDSIKQLEKARALQPTSIEVVGQLATLYAGTGQEKKAESAREALASLQAVAATSPQK